MGIGNKPCLDIKPSEDNIQDRSVNVALANRGGKHLSSKVLLGYLCSLYLISCVAIGKLNELQIIRLLCQIPLKPISGGSFMCLRSQVYGQ